MSLSSSSLGARRVRTPGVASSGSRYWVEETSSMPSSARTLAMAPRRLSVLRVRRLRSSLARRQSGRMLEKIWVCLTWPAMTARVTPAARKVSMRRESSPSESQWTRMAGSAAARASISGSVSSLMAATTTERPSARAASSRTNGKRPLPAMSPRMESLAFIRIPCSFSPLGTMTKQCHYERTTAQREGLHGVWASSLLAVEGVGLEVEGFGGDGGGEDEDAVAEGCGGALVDGEVQGWGFGIEAVRAEGVDGEEAIVAGVPVGWVVGVCGVVEDGDGFGLAVGGGGGELAPLSARTPGGVADLAFAGAVDAGGTGGGSRDGGCNAVGVAEGLGLGGGGF